MHVRNNYTLPPSNKKRVTSRGGPSWLRQGVAEPPHLGEQDAAMIFQGASKKSKLATVVRDEKVLQLLKDWDQRMPGDSTSDTFIEAVAQILLSEA